MEKILLDYSEYERLKGIEKQFNEQKQRHIERPSGTHFDSEAGTSSSETDIRQEGKGNVPTGFLQKKVLTEENGESDQKILANPSAPIIFTSDQSPPPTKKAKSKPEVSTFDEVKKKKDNVEKQSPSVPKNWWYLDWQC